MFGKLLVLVLGLLYISGKTIDFWLRQELKESLTEYGCAVHNGSCSNSWRFHNR